MGLIGRFREVDDIASIMVVVDRFSEYEMFIVGPTFCPFEIVTLLFYKQFKHVVKHFSRSTIVSDRDLKFLGRVLAALFKMMGTDLKFSWQIIHQSMGKLKELIICRRNA